MPEPGFNRWLHRFAVLTALATLALLGVGGLVTSHGVGMAVPDWPNTYGYNMFLFPPSKWVGGIFYEHSHRLVASGVGLLTAILAAWLWFAESRRWLRWLGLIAFFAVVLQGVLGGLRVVLFKDQIGIFHAALAQLFFALVCALALFTSRWWLERGVPHRGDANEAAKPSRPGISTPVRRLFLATTILIFLQLVLGATMRHQHAGLAIPDFPLAYGKLWPAMDAAAVAAYNAGRLEVTTANPITATQIGFQMAHRFFALAILVGAVGLAWQTRQRRSDAAGGGRIATRPNQGAGSSLRPLSFFWLGLIFVQAGLGAWTIWSQKAADVATAHVLVGALSLVTGVFGCLICFRHPAGIANVTVLATSAAAQPATRLSAMQNL